MKEKIIGEKLVKKEYRAWRKKCKLVAKLLKKNRETLIIPKILKK